MHRVCAKGSRCTVFVQGHHIVQGHHTHHVCARQSHAPCKPHRRNGIPIHAIGACAYHPRPALYHMIHTRHGLRNLVPTAACARKNPTRAHPPNIRGTARRPHSTSTITAINSYKLIWASWSMYGIGTTNLWTDVPLVKQ